MAIERSGDIVLPQGTYVLIQDGASGQVEVVVGPHKVSLADTDKTVVYNPVTRRYVPTASETAIASCPAANEGQYAVLTNPEAGHNSHPSKGKQTAVPLSIGNKINIPGPTNFALFPGQVAEVVDGHQLKSNQYVLARVYNEEAAKANLKNAIVRTTEGEGESKSSKESKKSSIIKEEDLFTGNLIIIKGTDVSFYIPSTGIEVLKDGASFVRDAVTLERLEYCILLDQNGDKRYVQGPAVVFPKPTEVFVEHNETTKFKAIELNDNMGIYVKVIADYTDGEKEYKAGEELFITGKEQKIYFPRPEHAIIKYGDEMMHYATAIPSGEGRYVLNKDTGSIDLIKGPRMFLPDPRKQVIVKRILDQKTVQLFYPGNNEALIYNQHLETESKQLNFGASIDYIASNTSLARNFSSTRNKMTLSSTAAASAVADAMSRSNNYSEPRSISLDNKYNGAVMVNIWPGYAVQVVKKTGERRVEIGPKSVMLEYDETLESLALSTGRPKSDKATFKTSYLQIKNNIVTDIVTVKTKDLVDVNLTLSYRVNFAEDESKWFSVSNYVKLLTQHIRSLVRNTVKKLTIESFNENSTDIIRDVILGVSSEVGRDGRKFDENGMHVYDVEVLDLQIGDDGIAELLLESQHDTVEQNLSIRKKEQEFIFTQKSEEIERKTIEESAKTQELRAKINLEKIDQTNQEESARLEHDKSKQSVLNEITAQTRERMAAKVKVEIDEEREKAKIRIEEAEKKAAAVQPKLIEAMITMGQLENNRILAENLKAQGGGLSGIFQKGGIDGLLEAVKGTPLEKTITDLFSKDSSSKTGKGK